MRYDKTSCINFRIMATQSDKDPRNTQRAHAPQKQGGDLLGGFALRDSEYPDDVTPRMRWLIRILRVAFVGGILIALFVQI